MYRCLKRREDSTRYLLPDQHSRLSGLQQHTYLLCSLPSTCKKKMRPFHYITFLTLGCPCLTKISLMALKKWLKAGLQYDVSKRYVKLRYITVFS